ncbi:MAG: outer membrane protein assembly factor BamA [Pelagibacterales bacterium]|nr:outer membrane protein assembly factor BamA [Pelagibacterales bacterium]
MQIKAMKKISSSSKLLLCLFSCLFFSANAFSSNIIIKGNERVTNSTIKSYISNLNQEGVSQKEIDEALKKLYESDLFSEVKIYPESDSVIVEVKENPIISEVKFIGNKKIEDEALQNEISLKKRSVFTKSKLQSDIKRINEIYLKSGRFLTTIDPKIVPKDQNRVELIFEIFEGKTTKISNIYFIGNENFSDQDLLDEISTKKSKWWRFFSSSDTYDSDRVEFDKEKLRRFYGSKGYADFNAISSIAQITPNKDKFFITFLIEEGIKYKLGNINIINHINKFDSSILEKEILVKKGKTYNSELIDKTVDRMVEVMSEKSYAFAHIEPVLKRNKETKVIDVDFVINETSAIYIDQITISGNTRTKDEVIRRELRIQEGDAYNITKINRSKQRIENLGFFDKVEFKTKRVSDSGFKSDKVNIEIIVKEKKTGELNLGIGYSTIGKATANIGIKERNLFGTGQELGINVQRSSLRNTSEINYTKPYFMGRPIDVGFDLSKYELNKLSTLVYDQTYQGIVFRGDYAITEFLKHQVRYSYSDQTVSNVSSGASQNIKNLQGTFKTSAVGQSFLYDKRDNIMNPKDGYYISLSQDYAGFVGGNVDNIKYEGSIGYYAPTFNDDYILKFLMRGGMIDGIGQDVRSNFGFFLGGNNFRGFEYAGLGPRVLSTGDVVGGNQYYVGTAEFMFPLGLPKELGINGILFSDNGTVKGVDNINKIGANVTDTGSLRSSYGLSIAWSSPMGPIRLDFSKVAKRETFDRTQTFRFSFGTSF